MLAQITSVTERPTYAQAYCVERFPILSTRPPAIANSTEGQLSFIKKSIHSESANRMKNCLYQQEVLLANLIELGEEIGHVLLALPKLAQGECNEDRGEEVGD